MYEYVMYEYSVFFSVLSLYYILTEPYNNKLLTFALTKTPRVAAVVMNIATWARHIAINNFIKPGLLLRIVPSMYVSC